MRKYLLLACLACVTQAFAQSATELPKLVPPSPEVASLMKAGLTSSSLHTGGASVSIPVYEVTNGSIRVPISINYSSSGIKVDEIPTRVGLGWNLSAGGMISRTIHDEPDGIYTTLTPPSDLSIHNQTLLDFLNSASCTGNFDTEPDQYSFHFPGGSGIFFVDGSGNVRCIPHNNLKITMGGTASARTFSIKTTDGTTYNFGGTGAVEKTSSFTVNGGVTKNEAYETAWFLTQISSITGENVMFNYASVSMNTIQGPFQTLIKPILPVSPNAYQCTNGTFTNTYSEATGVNTINYNSVQLDYIQSSNGCRVDFLYENRPDNSGDTRLKDIKVYSGTLATGHTLVKKFALEFDDNAVNSLPPNNNNSLLNKRYFLKKLKLNSLNSSDSSLAYTFDYIYQMGMSPRLSYAQDYFGYYNGIDNNSYFAPKYNQPLSVNASYGGDRTPNGAYGQKGLLQRVTYPTSGYEEFEYEPNTLGGWELKNTTLTSTVSGSGQGSNSINTYTAYTNTVKRNHSAKLSISAFENPAFPGSPQPNGTDILAEIKVLNGTTAIITRNLYTYTSEVYNVSLVANNSYTLQLKVWGEIHGGRADLIYDTASQDHFIWSNKDVGGLRVKKIAAFDPVTVKTTSRYYKYATRTDLGKSSGNGASQTDFAKPYEVGWLCQCGGGCPSHIINGDNYYVSSSSLIPSYSYGGSHIGYANVIECDDPDLKNGGTEHYFEAAGGSSIYEIFLGESMQGLPQNIRTDMNGNEYKTIVFKKSGNDFLPLKEVRHVHSYDSRIDNRNAGVIARKHWDGPAHFTPPQESEFEGFDLLKYQFVSYWPHLDTTITTEYDQNGQNPMTIKTIYTYNSVNHMAVTRTETYSSTGELLKTDTKYPEDFVSGSNVYNSMVQKYAVTAPVEQSSYRGSKLLSVTKTDYNDWFSDQKVLTPQIVNTQKGSSSSEPRIRFYGYDPGGNILEVSKESGMRISYLYDYFNDLPIAEVKNATFTNIAYTSFEAEGKGRWKFTGTPGTESSIISGNKSYSLSNGNIYRDSLSSSTTYIVTYWSKNGSVSSVGGTSRSLITISPWTCYEHTVSGVTTITLSGSATIDELRLYPQGAFMSTSCFEPLVGITAGCSPNNLFTYYEYDGFKRLLLVRDHRKNIIKQFDYKYKQVIASCANTNPDWQWTGEKRCVKNSNNNNTGEQEKEEKDMNNCSATYLQIRWVSLGTTGQCPPVSNCTGADKRVVNGTCETGVKVYTSSLPMGNGQWQCIYHYVWSDGFAGPDITETSNSPCNLQ